MAERLRDVPGPGGEGRAQHPRGARDADGESGPTAGCSRTCCRSPSRSSRSCALIPQPSGSSWPGSLRRWTETCKDIDIVATAHEPRALCARRSTELDVVLEAGSVRRRRHEDRHPQRRRGRAESRRAGAVRQPAPAPHRVEAAQRRAARARGQEGAARERVRDRGRRDRREAHLRDRGGGLRDGSASTTSSRSCARAAASSRPRASTGSRSWSTEDDMKGDLHCHTTASDGRNTLQQMAKAAQQARLHVPGDHRPLGLVRIRKRRPAGRAAASGRARAQDERGQAARVQGADRLGGEHRHRRLARLRGRGARRARLGDRLRALLLPDEREGDDRAHHGRDGQRRTSTPSGI